MRSINTAFVLLMLAIVSSAGAQTIRVNPIGVNVNSQNPTTVFLTFGQIPAGYRPAEAAWCGRLISVPPALGLQCEPGTVYGMLPARFDLSRSSGSLGITDIMSIPQSVVRQAFQAGASGGDAGFFYVRRFVSDTGGPDQFVSVTCRMSGGGARTPFALTEVEYIKTSNEPVVFLKPGDKLPVVGVDIRFNGTGRLKGRWELVLPGEDLPGDRDLLTEATLPIEERAAQRRYMQVERFNYFLPPTGRFKLELKNIDRLPLSVDGQYHLILRIEAVDDKEGDSNLAAIGVGPDVVHSGAVAGFPMPAFKFFVQGGNLSDWTSTGLLLPVPDAILGGPGNSATFTWRPLDGAAFYRLEFLDPNSTVRFQAIVSRSRQVYRAPPWLAQRFAENYFQWRVVALDEKGAAISKTQARNIRTK